MFQISKKKVNFMNTIKEHKVVVSIIGVLIVLLLGTIGFITFENHNVKATSSTEVKQMLNDARDKDTLFYVYSSEDKANDKYNKEINQGEKQWKDNNPDGQIINADLADDSTRQVLESNSNITLDNLKNKMPVISVIHQGQDEATISKNGAGTTDGKFVSSNLNKMFAYKLNANHEHNDLHSQLVRSRG